jgi:queuosine precursor transporter
MSPPNELLFVIQIVFLSLGAAWAFKLGKDALSAFMCLQAVIANVLVLKQITLFGYHVTSAEPFSVAAALTLLLLQERYGYAQARNTIWVSFCVLVIFTISCQLHLAFTPSVYDTSQEHFVAIFGFMPRLLSASVIAFLVSQYSDAYLYAAFSTWHVFPSATWKTMACLTISQLIDTILFTFLALYSISSHPGHIIIFSYTIKLCIIFLLTPLTRWLLSKGTSTMKIS